MSVNGVGPLVRYEGTMDRFDYIDILEANLLSHYPKLRGTTTRPSALLFQHDNASSHTAGDTITWLVDSKIYTLEWPSYSPDLNPIENLWGILQDRLYGYNDQLRTPDDVWEKTQEIWYNQLNEYVPKLYNSMPFRLEEVIDREGYPLDY